jgi:hypothetical protein
MATMSNEELSHDLVDQDPRKVVDTSIPFDLAHHSDYLVGAECTILYGLLEPGCVLDVLKGNLADFERQMAPPERLNQVEDLHVCSDCNLFDGGLGLREIGTP